MAGPCGITTDDQMVEPCGITTDDQTLSSSKIRRTVAPDVATARKSYVTPATMGDLRSAKRLDVRSIVASFLFHAPVSSNVPADAVSSNVPADAVSSNTPADAVSIVAPSGNDPDAPSGLLSNDQHHPKKPDYSMSFKIFHPRDRYGVTGQTINSDDEQPIDSPCIDLSDGENT